MDVRGIEETRDCGVGCQLVHLALVEEVEEYRDREDLLASEVVLEGLKRTYIRRINEATTMAQHDALGATSDCHMGDIHGCVTNTKNHDMLAFSKVLTALELRRVDGLGNLLDSGNCTR
jgi:hypothetical protein